jgi:hypothetical protein
MEGGIIILIAGDGGMGKTTQAQKFSEPIVHLDFEYPRAENTRKSQNPDRLITVMQCRDFYKKSDHAKNIKKGQIDIRTTYELIENTINKVLDNSAEYETIVLDSISDIRSVVSDIWLMDYNANSKNKDKKRKSIGKDPHAWSEINSIVCDELLFPIINTGRMEDKTVILTAKKEDQYKMITLESGREDTAKTGKREIDTQNWLIFEVDVIVDLEATEKGRYFMTCTKSPKGVIPRIDITDKTVYDVLCEKGVI